MDRLERGRSLRRRARGCSTSDAPVAIVEGLDRICSFPPVSDAYARILILGSMPGRASLAADEYYAHPRNAFWTIMAAVFSFRADLPYAERLSCLRAQRVALWDVLGSCRRVGSLDSAIEEASIVPNDLSGFLREHPGIAHIVFNGSKAEQAFGRYVLPGLDSARISAIARVRLPSTSPARASLSLADKLREWERALAAE